MEMTDGLAEAKKKEGETHWDETAEKRFIRIQRTLRRTRALREEGIQNAHVILNISRKDGGTTSNESV